MLCSAISCMCRHEEELWEEPSDPTPFFCGLIVLEKSKCYVYLSSLLVLYLAISSMCRHEEELWKEASYPRFFSCG